MSLIAATDQPRIAIVVEARHAQNRALVQCRRALESAGCNVPLVIPGRDALFDVPVEAPPWDAVLSRGRDLAGLGVLAAASALGVLTVNEPRAIELVRNKVAMQAVLLNHGLPLPRTWFATDPAVFRQVDPAQFPLVVKPFDGDGSRGLALLERPADVDLLAPLESRRSLYLAQELLETDGWDLKLYGVGSQVWAVRKRSPVSFDGPGPATVSTVEAAELVPINSELRDIALTCGRACGLELWGVDVAMTPRGPFVIEVNDFPTYSAVPEAGEAIAKHVLALTRIHAVARSAGRSRMLAIVRESV
ncbi:MAG: ATP-grasp domain-containing protein [Chloroflexota bacterium]